MSSIDETLNDVRTILEKKGLKCLLIYGEHGTEKPVKVKFNSSLLDLNSLAAASVLCVATELAQEFGYEPKDAVEMAIDSVCDQVRQLSAARRG